MEPLDHKRLTELVNYDPDTGVFTWKARGRGRVVGKELRRFDGRYIKIELDGRAYYAHRLAWFYVHGSMPEGEIDHKNEDKTDNRLDNLRLTDHSGNMLNISAPNRNSRSGYRGVCYRRGRWRATKCGRHLGDFQTVEEAVKAYKEGMR